MVEPNGSSATPARTPMASYQKSGTEIWREKSVRRHFAGQTEPLKEKNPRLLLHFSMNPWYDKSGREQPVRDRREECHRAARPQDGIGEGRCPFRKEARAGVPEENARREDANNVLGSIAPRGKEHRR